MTLWYPLVGPATARQAASTNRSAWNGHGFPKSIIILLCPTLFHGGFAIHGSYEINRLGGPASHGCIRLHPSDAAVLYTLVRTEGMSATRIVVSGSDLAATRDQPYFNYGTAYSNYGTPYAPGYRWPEKPNAYRPFYPY